MGRGEVVAPAIAEAERDLVKRPHLYTTWTQDERHSDRLNHGDKLGESETGRRICFDDAGGYERPDQRVENSSVKRRLKRIALEGADLFYRGEMGREIDADFRASGGRPTATDLAEYRTERLQPLWGAYRSHRIATNHPSGGGLLILEILRILDAFDVAAMGHNTPR